MDLDRQLHRCVRRADQHVAAAPSQCGHISSTRGTVRHRGGRMNWRRSLMGMAFGLPVVALLAFGMTRDPNAIPSVMPGKAAPLFALPVMDAAAIDSALLAQHRGQVVVL